MIRAGSAIRSRHETAEYQLALVGVVGGAPERDVGDGRRSLMAMRLDVVPLEERLRPSPTRRAGREPGWRALLLLDIRDQQIERAIEIAAGSPSGISRHRRSCRWRSLSWARGSWTAPGRAFAAGTVRKAGGYSDVAACATRARDRASPRGIRDLASRHRGDSRSRSKKMRGTSLLSRPPVHFHVHVHVPACPCLITPRVRAGGSVPLPPPCLRGFSLVGLDVATPIV